MILIDSLCLRGGHLLLISVCSQMSTAPASSVVLINEIETQYLRKYLADALATPTDGVGISIMGVVGVIASYAATYMESE